MVKVEGDESMGIAISATRQRVKSAICPSTFDLDLDVRLVPKVRQVGTDLHVQNGQGRRVPSSIGGDEGGNYLLKFCGPEGDH